MPGLARIGFQPNMLPGLKLAFLSDLGVTDTGGVAKDWANQGYQTTNIATQTVIGKRPAITTGLNNYKGLLFDGVDDFLGLPVNVVESFVTHFWVVTGLSTNSGTREPWVGSNASLVMSSRNWGVYENALVLSGVTLALATPYVLSAVVRAVNDCDLATNGALVNAVNGTGTPGRPSSAIGSGVAGGNPVAGLYMTLFLYDRVLTVLQRKAVERWLASRYAVAVAA